MIIAIARITAYYGSRRLFKGECRLRLNFVVVLYEGDIQTFLGEAREKLLYNR